MTKQKILNALEKYPNLQKMAESKVTPEFLETYQNKPIFLNDYSGNAVILNLPKKIVRPVLSYGSFVQFPGFDEEDIPLYRDEYVEEDTLPRFISFDYSLEYSKEENMPLFILYWTIQPDGRYYADDGGFGEESQIEIELYAFLNENGEFVSQFRLAKLDMKHFTPSMEEIPVLPHRPEKQPQQTQQPHKFEHIRKLFSRFNNSKNKIN